MTNENVTPDNYYLKAIHDSQKLINDNPEQQERLMSRKEAAKILGVCEGTLCKWASTGLYNLPFVKIGHMVRYKLSDILKFMQRRTVTNTHDAV